MSPPPTPAGAAVISMTGEPEGGPGSTPAPDAPEPDAPDEPGPASTPEPGASDEPEPAAIELCKPGHTPELEL